MSVPVLFTRKRSVYAALGCDCYGVDRNALTWHGGRPAIFHPPCRSWGRLRQFAKPRPGERELAVWAMDMARRFGGVVEHPLDSLLWAESGCLSWGVRDQFGGVLLPLYQSWLGHRAPKATGLYFVRVPLPDIQPGPYGQGRVARMSQAARERTPEPLARLLVELVGGAS